METVDNKFIMFIYSVIATHGLAAGYTSEYIHFENYYIKGTITVKKPYTIKWMVKDGFEVFDTPLAKGHSSASFSTVSDMLNFIGRRLARKT